MDVLPPFPCICGAAAGACLGGLGRASLPYVELLLVTSFFAVPLSPPYPYSAGPACLKRTSCRRPLPPFPILPPLRLLFFLPSFRPFKAEHIVSFPILGHTYTHRALMLQIWASEYMAIEGSRGRNFFRRLAAK